MSGSQSGREPESSDWDTYSQSQPSRAAPSSSTRSDSRGRTHGGSGRARDFSSSPAGPSHYNSSPPTSPLDASSSRPRHSPAGSSMTDRLPPIRTARAHTIDRIGSIIGPISPNDGSTATIVGKLNYARGKVLDATSAALAEIELRLGLRTLPSAQAIVRLERLHLRVDEGAYGLETDLAQALLGEEHAALARLEGICDALRSCNVSNSCCECQLPVPCRAGPRFTVADQLGGRTIQSFLDECADNVRSAKIGVGEVSPLIHLRAVYSGLDQFFLTSLGTWDQTKDRCQSVDGFLQSWRTMIDQPSYLNLLDAEIAKLQAEAIVKRERGEHADRQKLSKRFTNFLQRTGSRQGGKQTF